MKKSAAAVGGAKGIRLVLRDRNKLNAAEPLVLGRWRKHSTPSVFQPFRDVLASLLGRRVVARIEHLHPQCRILEGGSDAFLKRERRYALRQG